MKRLSLFRLDAGGKEPSAAGRLPARQGLMMVEVFR